MAMDLEGRRVAPLGAAHDEPLLERADEPPRALGLASRLRLWRAAVGAVMLVGACALSLAAGSARSSGGLPNLAVTAPEATSGWPFEVVQHPLAVSPEWGVISRPYPTGAWWTNLVVTDAYQKAGNQPAVMLPYAIRNQNGRGLEVSYGPTRRTVTPLFEGDYFGSDLIVGAATNSPLPQTYSHRVTASSPLTLAVEFSARESRGDKFVARLARGAPWIVTEWSGATPSVRSDFVLLSLKAIGSKPEPPADAPKPAEAHKAVLEEAEAPVAAVDPLCSAHKDCAILAASVADGLCCPLTANGIMLECCDAPRPPPPKPKPTPTPVPDINAPPSESDGDEVGPSDLFVLKLQTGQTWLAAFDSPVTLKWYTNPGRFEAQAAYTGTVRLAFAHDLDSLRSLATLAHGPYAVGSKVRVQEDEEPAPHAQPAGGAAKPAAVGADGAQAAESSDRLAAGPAGATLIFEWEVAGDLAETAELVTLALPHHIATLASGSVWRDGPHFESVKGQMTPIRGNQWSVHEKYVPISWLPPRAPAHEMASTIASSLQADLAQPLILQPDAKDIYGFGKQASRLARLALIADELGDAVSLQAATAALTQALLPWVTATNAAPWPTAQPGSGALVYDATYGGLVSRVGLGDPAADFGNGRYNDHHFQVGYLLYAAAVACKFDAGFCEAHKPAIATIARDIAMPPDDALADFFPVARCKDLYDGHSWASGLFQMADGKSQESSSEAANAYYGAALVAEAIGDDAMLRYAKLLLATEIRSTGWYWHVPSTSQVYDPAFTANNRMVGVVGATDVNVATWFGANLEYVHGINIMPITPVTEALLPASYVAEQYAQLATRHGKMEGAWAGFAVAAHAILDPAAALRELAELNAYDNGNTRTNMLHWIATRPKPPSALLLALATVRSPSASAHA